MHMICEINVRKFSLRYAQPHWGYRLGKWPPSLELDFGQPLAAPAVASGVWSRVWSREWSKAKITLNCSSWEARIELK